MFVWLELIQQNIKGLGKIDRKGKCQFYWAMESKRSHEKLINGYGISKGKYNLATGSFGFEMRWTSMIWKENFNPQQREFESIT